MALDRDAKKSDVRERTSIVEIIKRHVDLRRAGTQSWKGLCPFHAEKTPSFHVNERHQYFHCFGCGEKGDVFAFLMKVESRGFKEVLHDLAGQAGVELDDRPLSSAQRRALAEAESERERMLRVTELAVQFFEAQYAGAAGETARSYVEGRGISTRIVERFRLGFAPPGWHALEAHLAAQKVPPAVAERLGLVGVKDGRRFDLFRDRVMLPVLDRQRRPVGFSSRLLAPDAKDRKYVNSPDSELFHKKTLLYGVHAALDAIRKSGTALVVEGNFDVLALHEAGVEEAVAPMGTALTEEQVALLGRLAQRVIVLFDGDDAGQRAARKAIPLFVDAGVDGRIARLPRGVDPDDFVRTEGREALRRILDGARPALDQLIDDAAADADLSTIPGRVRALEDAAPLLARARNTTARELYAGRLAATLGLSPQQVARALRGASSTPRTTAQRPGRLEATASPTDVVPPRSPPREELEVLAILHAHPALARSPEVGRLADLLVDPAVRQLYRLALEALLENDRLDVPAWLDAGPADVRAALAAALADERFGGIDNPERTLTTLRLRLERLRIEAEIGMMKRQHREALARGDEAAARAISVRELELIRTKQGLNETPARPSA